jgi:hypothetical protein
VAGDAGPARRTVLRSVAQLGAASRLPLGRSQWCLVDAMSGNTDLRCQT